MQTVTKVIISIIILPLSFFFGMMLRHYIDPYVDKPPESGNSTTPSIDSIATPPPPNDDDVKPSTPDVMNNEKDEESFWSYWYLRKSDAFYVEYKDAYYFHIKKERHPDLFSIILKKPNGDELLYEINPDPNPIQNRYKYHGIFWNRNAGTFPPKFECEINTYVPLENFIKEGGYQSKDRPDYNVKVEKELEIWEMGKNKKRENVYKIIPIDKTIYSYD